MAPKENEKKDAKGLAPDIKERFAKGELDIPLEIAKRYIPVCGKFTKKGFTCKGILCGELHIAKDGKLRPSLGLYRAVQFHNDPIALPSVRIDPVLALQGFLLAQGSGLIVDRMIDKEGAYVFKFADQPIPPHVVEIARQRFVNVEHDGDIRQVCASGDQDAPTLCLHCVKQFSLGSSLDILVNGFDYGAVSSPFGIYTVDANVENQSKMIASYDGGAAIVLKPTGFLVNISTISSGGKKRKNPYEWLTGAVPGAILFRRMASNLREYILHQDSVQFHYLSMEHALFDSWVQRWGPRNVDSVRRAHDMREAMRERRDAVPASQKSSAMEKGCCEAQTPAGPSSSRRVAMTVAQPRTRSESRSRSPQPSGSGVEIRPPADIGGPVQMAEGGLSAMARSAQTRYPQRDERFFTPVFDAQAQRTFRGAAMSVDAEPDRRGFIRSSVRYLQYENDEAVASSQASGFSQTSLGAVREVLAVEAPGMVHSVVREESLDLHERILEITQNAPDAWRCAGPGCGVYLRDKSEWQRQRNRHARKTYYYCKQCWNTSNTVALS